MSNWNLPVIGGGESSGTTSASSTGLVLSTSYQSFPAATTYEWAGFNLMLLSRSVGSDIDISVARGSAGNEFTLIDQMRLGTNGSTYGNCQLIHYPLRVPKGERVAIKMSAASSGTQAKIMGFPMGFPGMVPSGAFLERLAAAGGVNIDPGGSANAKGSYTSLGTTSSEWRGLYINMWASSGLGMDLLVDIAVDIGGNKMILAGCDDIPAAKGSSSALRPNFWGLVPCNLPAGSALYARAQCTSTTGGSRTLNVNAFGVVG